MIDANEIITMSSEVVEAIQGKQAAIEKPKDTATVITVEHSLAVVSELISEIEADDPPTQSQSQETQIVDEATQTSYKHRFSLYKKNSTSPGIPAGQLKLFHSFAKSIKTSDHSS